MLRMLHMTPNSTWGRGAKRSTTKPKARAAPPKADPKLAAENAKLKAENARLKKNTDSQTSFDLDEGDKEATLSLKAL